MMKKLSGKEKFHLRWWFRIVGARKFKRVEAKNSSKWNVKKSIWWYNFLFVKCTLYISFHEEFFGLDFLTFFGPMWRNLVLQYFYYTQLNLTIFEIYWCLSIIIGTFLLYNTVWLEKQFCSIHRKGPPWVRNFHKIQAKKNCVMIFLINFSVFFIHFLKVIFLRNS